MQKLIAIILLFNLVFTGCKNKKNTHSDNENKGVSMMLTYATGFSVTDYGDHKVLEIKNPWPDAEKNYKYLLVNKNKKFKNEPNGFDGIIPIPVERIVVTSTTHIPALDLLNSSETLVGFPGTDYISSESIRTRIDNELVKELGKNEGINTEILLTLQPDVVVGFGIDGNNKTFETIRKSNIPVIYNGDWMEASPLAKAEWIKFFGALFNKSDLANKVFNNIENDYLEAKKIANEVKTKPSILSGAMTKDVWHLPKGSSAEGQLLKDANTNYLWQDTHGGGSLSLNFETVLSQAQEADIWLSPSHYRSLEEIQNANPHYTQFKAFKTGEVYAFTNTTGATDGVLYFELGMARPDIVLKDLIKICHPNLLPDYEPFFFKKLN